MAKRTIMALAASTMLVAVQALGADDDKDEKAPIKPENVVEVSAGELAAKPAEYLGLRVKVRAEIEDVHSPRVFTLDEDKIGASPDVLVIAPQGGAFPKDGNEVVVTGTVRKFVRTDIERDYSWFDLGKEYDVKYTERPVIVAESVLPADK